MVSEAGVVEVADVTIGAASLLGGKALVRVTPTELHLLDSGEPTWTHFGCIIADYKLVQISRLAKPFL